jgi:hypothetical protein
VGAQQSHFKTRTPAWRESGHVQLLQHQSLGRLREQKRAVEALCRMRSADGRTTAAFVADHVAPHRGDPEPSSPALS